MTNDAEQRLADAERNRRTYKAIISASGQIGVPLSLGLTMFFTNLVLANGIFVAFVAALVTYFFVFYIAKTFFSH